MNLDPSNAWYVVVPEDAAEFLGAHRLELLSRRRRNLAPSSTQPQIMDSNMMSGDADEVRESIEVRTPSPGIVNKAQPEVSEYASNRGQTFGQSEIGQTRAQSEGGHRHTGVLGQSPYRGRQDLPGVSSDMGESYAQPEIDHHQTGYAGLSGRSPYRGQAMPGDPSLSPSPDRDQSFMESPDPRPRLPSNALPQPDPNLQTIGKMAGHTVICGDGTVIALQILNPIEYANGHRDQFTFLMDKNATFKEAMAHALHVWRFPFDSMQFITKTENEDMDEGGGWKVVYPTDVVGDIIEPPEANSLHLLLTATRNGRVRTPQGSHIPLSSLHTDPAPPPHLPRIPPILPRFFSHGPTVSPLTNTTPQPAPLNTPPRLTIEQITDFLNARQEQLHHNPALHQATISLLNYNFNLADRANNAQVARNRNILVIFRFEDNRAGITSQIMIRAEESLKRVGRRAVENFGRDWSRGKWFMGEVEVDEDRELSDAIGLRDNQVIRIYELEAGVYEFYFHGQG